MPCVTDELMNMKVGEFIKQETLYMSINITISMIHIQGMKEEVGHN